MQMVEYFEESKTIKPIRVYFLLLCSNSKINNIYRYHLDIGKRTRSHCEISGRTLQRVIRIENKS